MTSNFLDPPQLNPKANAEASEGNFCQHKFFKRADLMTLGRLDLV